MSTFIEGSSDTNGGSEVQPTITTGRWRYRVCGICSVNWILTQDNEKSSRLIVVCDKCRKTNSLSIAHDEGKHFSDNESNGYRNNKKEKSEETSDSSESKSVTYNDFHSVDNPPLQDKCLDDFDENLTLDTNHILNRSTSLNTDECSCPTLSHISEVKHTNGIISELQTVDYSDSVEPYVDNDVPTGCLNDKLISAFDTTAPSELKITSVKTIVVNSNESESVSVKTYRQVDPSLSAHSDPKCSNTAINELLTVDYRIDNLDQLDLDANLVARFQNDRLISATDFSVSQQIISAPQAISQQTTSVPEAVLQQTAPASQVVSQQTDSALLAISQQTVSASQAESQQTDSALQVVSRQTIDGRRQATAPYTLTILPTGARHSYVLPRDTEDLIIVAGSLQATAPQSTFAFAEVAPQSVSVSQAVDQHLRLCAHEPLRYVCPICCQRFAERIELINHEQLHRTDLIVKCGICNGTYKTDLLLQIHCLQKHFDISSRFYYCSLCVYRTECVETFVNHAHLHTGQIPYASVSVSVSQAADQHLQLSEPKPLRHVCPICCQRFAERIQMTNHEQLHRTDLNVKCGICHEMYETDFLLEEHCRQKHFDILRQLYICSLCLYTANNVSVFCSHVHLHTGEIPYVCTQCGKKYVCKNSLMQHIKSRHQNERHHNALSKQETAFSYQAGRRHIFNARRASILRQTSASNSSVHPSVSQQIKLYYSSLPLLPQAVLQQSTSSLQAVLEQATADLQAVSQQTTSASQAVLQQTASASQAVPRRTIVSRHQATAPHTISTLPAAALHTFTSHQDDVNVIDGECLLPLKKERKSSLIMNVFAEETSHNNFIGKPNVDAEYGLQKKQKESPGPIPQKISHQDEIYVLKKEYSLSPKKPDESSKLDDDLVNESEDQLFPTNNVEVQCTNLYLKYSSPDLILRRVDDLYNTRIPCSHKCRVCPKIFRRISARAKHERSHIDTLPCYSANIVDRSNLKVISDTSLEKCVELKQEMSSKPTQNTVVGVSQMEDQRLEVRQTAAAPQAISQQSVSALQAVSQQTVSVPTAVSRLTVCASEGVSQLTASASQAVSPQTVFATEAVALQTVCASQAVSQQIGFAPRAVSQLTAFASQAVPQQTAGSLQTASTPQATTRQTVLNRPQGNTELLLENRPKHQKRSAQSIICKLCSFESKNIFDYFNHTRLHSSKELYACKHCGIRYSIKTGFVNHIKSAHQNVSFLEMVSEPQSAFAAKRKTHLLESALEGVVAQQTVSALQSVVHHNVTVNQAVSHQTNESRHQCTAPNTTPTQFTAPNTAPNLASFPRQTVISHKDENIVINVENSPPLKKKNESLAKLDDDPVNNNPSDDRLSQTNKVEVPIANVNLKYSPDLILSHIDDLYRTRKPCCHQCRVCPKIFQRISARARHERTVHVRTFISRQCYDGPRHRNRFNVHTAERPFVCTKCGERYSRISHLFLHIKSFHSVQYSRNAQSVLEEAISACLSVSHQTAFAHPEAVLHQTENEFSSTLDEDDSVHINLSDDHPSQTSMEVTYPDVIHTPDLTLASKRKTPQLASALELAIVQQSISALKPVVYLG